MRTMASACFALSGLLLLQGVWCAPADSNTVSTGTKLSEDFNKNLALVLSNLHNGVSGVVRPPIKFGVDTIPSVVNYGVTTAADKAVKLANANQEALGKIAVGASNALGGGAVLGSSVAGGALTVAGHGLEAANNLIGTGAKIGMDLAGKVADHTAGAAQVVGTVANSALTGLGDGMIAFGGGAGLLSKNLANVIDTVGGRLTVQLSAIKDIVAKLMDSGAAQLSNGALSFTTEIQTNVYNVLNSYMGIMMQMQKLFDSYIASINSMDVMAGITTATGTGTTGTATSGAGTTGTATSGAGTTSTATSGGGGAVGTRSGAGITGAVAAGSAASDAKRAGASAAASVGVAQKS